MPTSAPPPSTACTDCGVSRMADPKRRATACQFIQPDYPALETQVRGRHRDPARPDELHFAGDEVATGAPGSRGKRAGAVRGFIANVARAAGGLPLRSMPDWLRPIVGWLMPRIGPRGLEFARTRVEMMAAETILHLRRDKPRRMRRMIPAHVWALVAPYGLTPAPASATERRCTPGLCAGPPQA